MKNYITHSFTFRATRRSHLVGWLLLLLMFLLLLSTYSYGQPLRPSHKNSPAADACPLSQNEVTSFLLGE